MPPPNQSMLHVAHAIQPTLRQRAVEIEKACRLPSDLAKTLAEAGLYRMCMPLAYGGLERDPLEFTQTIEVLAQADGAAAWCVMIGATTALTTAYLAPHTARELCRDPNVIFAGAFAPRGTAVDQGTHYSVDGKWQWGSGSDNAHYILGGCIVVQDGKPQMLASGHPHTRMLIARKDQVHLAANWDVMGLCGTGSQDFSFDGLHIAKEMSVGLTVDKPLERPLYSFPVFGLLAIGIASVMLGLGRAAIDELTTFAEAKTPEGHRKPLATRGRTQNDVAQAEALIRSARNYLHEVIAYAWAQAASDARIDLERRRDLRLASSHAAKAATQAVDMIFALAGGTAVYRASPLQRIFRDIHVAGQHMMVAQPTWELAGRLFLGQETDTSVL